MRFRFSKRKLKVLYEEEKGANNYEQGVVDAFFEVMDIIKTARDEKDIRAFKSLRYEKLKGRRRHERSLRLTGKWRFIVEIRKDNKGKYLWIKDIEDYH